MKKKLLFGILIGAMLCALPFCLKTKKTESAYAVSTEQEETVQDNKWTKEDFKEIFAYVGIGAGGVGTALAFYIPIYVKLKKTQKDIVEAKTGITSEKKDNEDTSQRLKQQKLDYEKSMKHTDEMLSSMNNKLKEIEQICKLGFINNKELVTKGIATTISKVGQDEEHKE